MASVKEVKLPVCGNHVHEFLDGLPAKARAVVVLRHHDPKECALCRQRLSAR